MGCSPHRSIVCKIIGFLISSEHIGEQRRALVLITEQISGQFLTHPLDSDPDGLFVEADKRLYSLWSRQAQAHLSSTRGPRINAAQDSGLDSSVLLGVQLEWEIQV